MSLNNNASTDLIVECGLNLDDNKTNNGLLAPLTYKTNQLMLNKKPIQKNTSSILSNNNMNNINNNNNISSNSNCNGNSSNNNQFVSTQVNRPSLLSRQLEVNLLTSTKKNPLITDTLISSATFNNNNNNNNRSILTPVSNLPNYNMAQSHSTLVSSKFFFKNDDDDDDDDDEDDEDDYAENLNENGKKNNTNNNDFDDNLFSMSQIIIDDAYFSNKQDEINLFDRTSLNVDTLGSIQINGKSDSSSLKDNNSSNNLNKLIEGDFVRNKLTSLWNNFKYGWVPFKKANRINFDKDGPIYIMGKKFNLNNQTEKQLNNNLSQIGTSSFYDFVDAANLESLSESFIKPSIPIIRNQSSSSHEDYYLTKPNSNYSINDIDYSSLASSPCSISPRFNNNNKQAILFNNNKHHMDASYYLVDDLTVSINNNSNINNNNNNNNPTKRNRIKKTLSPSDFSHLQNDNMKTSLEQEIHSRLWFTYRKDFKPLNGNSKYTSDCGWGCMLRSAQMLIAQGLLYHFFGKEWSLYKTLKSNFEYNLYKDIISWFNDRPSNYCPFGLHRLLQIADEKLIGNPNPEYSTGSNKSVISRVGSWFGPTSVCLLMKDALNEAIDNNSALNKIRIYVAQDCTIYKQDVIDLCTKQAATSKSLADSSKINSSDSLTNIVIDDSKIKSDQFTPCIILVSVRLGGEELNEIYVPSLKMFLGMDMCIGMIGGKPKHSLYFIGYQGDKVIYLDPHFCQPSVNIYSSNETPILNTSTTSSSSSKFSYDDTTPSDYEFFDNSSFHCTTPSKTLFSKLDPSLAIGFYCSTLNELNNFCDLVKKISSSDSTFPIFGISEDSFERAQLNYQILSDDEKPSSESKRINNISNENNKTTTSTNRKDTDKTPTNLKEKEFYSSSPTSNSKNSGYFSTVPFTQKFKVTAENKNIKDQQNQNQHHHHQQQQQQSSNSYKKTSNSYLTNRLLNGINNNQSKSATSKLKSETNDSKPRRKSTLNDPDDFVLV